jgi:hypothetical protein
VPGAEMPGNIYQQPPQQQNPIVQNIQDESPPLSTNSLPKDNHSSSGPNRSLQVALRDQTIAMPLEKDQVVFLGVKNGDDYALAQIFVSGMDDDTFFEALRDKYNKLRGVFRQYLSHEIYHCCEFVQVSQTHDMGFQY